MNVIGLDIASQTGWVILSINENKEVKIDDRGSIILDSRMDLSQRLRYFSVELSRIFENHNIDYVFIEDVLLGISGVKTLAYLARLNGVAVNTAFTYVKENVKLYQPSYWKSNSFRELKGTSPKWEIQLSVCNYFNIKIEESFFKSFSLKQCEFEKYLFGIKDTILNRRTCLNSYKTSLTRKRNPLSQNDKDELKILIETTEKEITTYKKELVDKEKEFDKFMNKISIDISAQTGISTDIADACGIALCGLKELKII